MSTERKSTMVELVDELRLLPQTPVIEKMIEEALAGEYHDFKNVKYPCGKMASYKFLMQAGHRALASRIANGEFDELADEDDKQKMREELNDPALAKVLGLD